MAPLIGFWLANSILHRLGVVAHTCNLSTQEQMEVQKVKDILNYTLSFKVILGYMRYCLSGERFKLHFSKVIFYN